MITNRQQLEDWIKDGGFNKWFFSQTDHNQLRDGERPSDFIVRIDINDSKEPLDAAIDRTYKYLALYGQRCYGQGFTAKGATSGGCTMTAQISESSIYAQQPSVAGLPVAAPAPVDEAALAQKIRREIMVEMQEKEFEAKRKQLDQERREFERDKQGAMGMLVGYLKPILGAMVPAAGTRVAGVDQPGVVAEPIKVQEAETVEEDIFTDEEADELLDLMARFKKVEPEYLTMIRKVVAMAESGDNMYGMAKQFLCQ